MSEDLLSYQYSKRQMIVVGDYPRLNRVPIPQDQQGGWTKSKTIGTVAAGIGAAAIAATGVGLVAEVAAAATAATVAGGATGFGAGLLAKKKSTGNSTNTQAPWSYLEVPIETARSVKWSTIIPQPNTLYIGHPFKPEVYYPAEDFHQSIIVSKYGELVRLIMALRPREFVVEHVTGWTAEGKMGLRLQTLKRAGSGSGNLTYKHNKDSKVITRGSFSKPGFIARLKRPAIPQDLVWLPLENTWQALVDARLNGLQEIDIELESTIHFGITVQLGAALKKVKNLDVSLDAEHAHFKKTVWHISGCFW